MRWCLGLVSAVLLPAMSAALRLPPEKANDLLGTWVGVESFSGGQRAEFTGVWEVREGVIRGIPQGRPADAEECRYEVDRGRTPRHIDLYPKGGRAPLKGVYVVDGDHLRVCFVSPAAADPAGQPRPRSVAQWADPGVVVQTFERARP